MKKVIFCQIISILWKRERCWCYYLIVLIAIMLLTKFESLQISTPFSVKTANSINDMLFAISSSFIVGIIIYLATVSVPFYRSFNSVSSEISEIFRAIKDTYRDLSGEIGGGDWIEKEQIKQNAIQSITKTDNPKENTYINQLLSLYSSKLDNQYLLLIPYYTYLDFDIRELLAKIKTSESMQRIRKIKESNELLDEEKAKTIINDLISHNEIIINIYNKFQKQYLK